MALTPEQRTRFLEVVDLRFGIRESEYGTSRLDDAVAGVLPSSGCATPAELLGALDRDAHPKWLDSLVEHLTVGETYFFRDPTQVASLRELILPSLIERRMDDRRLRIWSAGCSTGEEPYTMALLLREFPVLATWQIMLIGTDVNRESLMKAREGSYAPWSFRATPENVRLRYFESLGNNRWRVANPVRQMVRFAWLNLGANPLVPPSAELDLITCRNVTIYFDDIATQRLYRSLIQALAPGGWLLLGPSDPLPAERDLLERVELSGAVLWRRRVAAPAVARPLPVPAAQRPKLPLPQRRARERVEVRSGRAASELEAGLLALEAGSAGTALEWLRRATFRDPHNPLSQFGLGRAYLGVGDMPRAQAALQHARRLLADLEDDAQVAGTDGMSVESLRQAVLSHLSALEDAA